MLLQEFDCGSEAGWFLFEILITVRFIVCWKIMEGGLEKNKEKEKDLNIFFVFSRPVVSGLAALKKPENKQCSSESLFTDVDCELAPFSYQEWCKGKLWKPSVDPHYPLSICGNGHGRLLTRGPCNVLCWQMKHRYYTFFFHSVTSLAIWTSVKFDSMFQWIQEYKF